MGLPLLATPFDRVAYLEWESTQATKNEYLAGEVFAMVGARQDHVLVSLRLANLFLEHLRGTRCRTYTSDMKLEVVSANAVFYPDVMVSCDEADRQAPIALHSPCLLVEVLSESTAAFDRGRKFAAYRQIASLREYLLVDVETRRLELFRRESVGWVLYEPQGLPAQVQLASIDMGLMTERVFQDLDEVEVGRTA